MAVNGPAGGAPRLPALGEYEVGSGRAVKVAQVIVAAGDTLGAAAAASDSNTFVNLFTDTQEPALELFNIEGPGLWVEDVFHVVVTAFTASVTYICGDTDDINGWYDDTLGVLTSSNQGVTTYPTNLDTAGDFAFRLLGGKYFATSSGTIEAAIAGADVAAGRLAVYAQYFVAENAIYG